ncbi:MAG: hypothetical protein Q9187_004082 [Circinaria calcarea]
MQSLPQCCDDTEFGYIFCPNNFPGASKPPEVNDSVVLYFRESDTKSVTAIALMQNEKFLGWVCREDRQRVASLVERVSETGYRLEATITTVRPFDWAEGGGACRGGSFTIGLYRDGDGDVLMS